MLLRLLVICATTTAISGCSYRVDFAVVNASPMDAVLTVHISSQGACRLNEASFETAPAEELKPGWFKRKQPNWVSMDPGSYTLSGESCSLTTVVAANSAMKVAEVYNHPEPKNAELSLLEVQRVSIQWPNGAAQHFEPETLAQQFVEARPRLWAVFPEPEA